MQFREGQNQAPARKPSLFLAIVALLGLLTLTSGCLPSPEAVGKPTDDEERLASRKIEEAVRTLHERGDRHAARAAVTEAVQLRGGRSGAVASVGKELVERGVPPFAATFLSEAIKEPENAENPLVWASLALAYDGAGDGDEAEKAQQEARRRAEAILARIGSLKPAREEDPSPTVQSAVRRLFQAGSYYSEVENDPRKALQAMREAYRLLPENPFTINALGYTLADKGTTRAEFKEALELTRKAAEKAPKEGNILDSYGWALYRNGDLKGARRILRDAVSLEPGVPELHYHLGTVMAELGETHAARIELNRALRLRPEYPEASKLLSQLNSPGK